MHGASARCLPNLIVWSGFDIAHVDGIVMNVLVVEIKIWGQREYVELMSFRLVKGCRD